MCNTTLPETFYLRRSSMTLGHCVRDKECCPLPPSPQGIMNAMLKNTSLHVFDMLQKKTTSRDLQRQRTPNNAHSEPLCCVLINKQEALEPPSFCVTEWVLGLHVHWVCYLQTKQTANQSNFPKKQLLISTPKR